MKLQAIVIASLLLLSVSCGKQKLYGTINDAFSENLGDLDPKTNLGRIQPGRIRNAQIMFECSKESLGDFLQAEGIHPVLSKKIVKMVRVPKDAEDFMIRFVEQAPIRVNNFAMQTASCGYRLAGNGKLHFLCIASHGLADQDSDEDSTVTQDMKDAVALFYNINSHKYSRFHSFNSLGFVAPQSLGALSEKQQGELDKFFTDAGIQKEQQWQDVYNNRNDPFMVKLFKNGITHFTSNSKVSLTEGIDEAKIKGYTNYLMQNLKVPAKDRKKFEQEVELAALGDKGEWKEMDFIFKESKGKGKYTMLMVVQDQNSQRYDFLIVDVKSTFELGDDVFVYTVNKSAVFGLWKWQEIKVERRPATLTEQSLKFMFGFFKYAALESFGKFRSGIIKYRNKRAGRG